MRRPIDGAVVITGEFGEDYGSLAKFRYHSGVDYAKPTGSNVYAPVSGQVTNYTFGEYHGHVVQIVDAQGRYHRLMHNSQLLVKPNQWVAEGQIVAKSGATGKGVTGAHVHWDIADRKIPVAFSNFFSPAKLLFAPQNIVQKVTQVFAPKRLYVCLPNGGKWAVYRVGSGLRKNTSDQIGAIDLDTYGPIKYPVLSRVGDYAVKIRTQTWGEVTIWTKGTVAEFKEL